MSLSAAMNIALTGLSANIRAAGLVSNNIANADIDGYGRRILDLSTADAAMAGGVQVTGIIRQTDKYLIADRRVVEAELANADELHSFYDRLEFTVGGPEDADSLSNLMTAFENAINTASANPAEELRLENLAYAADDLVSKINSISQEIQSSREEADAEISNIVEEINENLGKIAEINAQIIAVGARNGDISPLEDQRQVLVDAISENIPLTTKLKDNGVMYLYATSGMTLLERNYAELEFSQSNLIPAQSTYENGDLSGIILNDHEINISPTGQIAGGRLAALFEIRDEIAVEQNSQLDAIARDLIERFEDPTLDATLAPGDPGLFTDQGAAFDPLDEVGLASRLELNADVSPGSTEYWKLRDGIGAVVQGNVGDATLLNAYSDAISAQTLPSSPALLALSTSFTSHVQDFSSATSSYSVRSENNLAFTNSRFVASKEAELQLSVDTDQELQLLMRIEQQYAANAQVLTVIDELMERLVNIF